MKSLYCFSLLTTMLIYLMNQSQLYLFSNGRIIAMFGKKNKIVIYSYALILTVYIIL